MLKYQNILLMHKMCIVSEMNFSVLLDLIAHKRFRNGTRAQTAGDIRSVVPENRYQGQGQVVIFNSHYDDVIMTMLASQITSLTVVYSIVYSGVNQRKHQSSASLAIVREIHRGPVNFPHKWPVTRKMFPFDDVIMVSVGCNYLPLPLIPASGITLLICPCWHTVYTQG